MFKNLLLASLLTPFIANAQMDNLKNVSSEWIRTANRNATTTSVDAVAFNPAGLVELGEGIHISVGNQMFIRHPKQEFNSFLTYTDVEKAHSGIDWLAPNIFAAYVINPKMAVSTGIYVIGGGGTADFTDGSITTEKILSSTDAAIIKGYKTAVPTIARTGYSQSMEGSSFQIAVPLNFTYKFNDKLSAAIGGKIIYSTKSNSASAILTYNYTPANKDLALDVTQSGIGFNGVVGINYKPLSNLTLALTYESIAKIKLKTDVSKDLPSPKNLFVDGEEMQRDFAPSLRFGAEYKLDKLTLLADFYYYFQTQADWEYKSTNSTTSVRESTFLSEYAGDVWSAGLGADYKINDKLTYGIGFSYSDYLFEDVNKYYTKATGFYETIKNDNITVGTGLSYKINDIIGVNIGYSFTKYFEATLTDLDIQAQIDYYKSLGVTVPLKSEVVVNNWISNIAVGVTIKL